MDTLASTSSSCYLTHNRLSPLSYCACWVHKKQTVYKRYYFSIIVKFNFSNSSLTSK
jgi:hypothetical protein